MLSAVLIKYGVIVIAFLALCVGLISYGSHRKQLEWDASITKQAMRSASQVIAQAVNTAQVEQRYIQVEGKTRTKIQVVEREVIRYVETHSSEPCTFSPDFVRTYDDVSRMLDTSTDGMPASSGPTGAPIEPSSPYVGTTEVLQSHHDAVRELAELWDTYHALVEWVRSDYQTALGEQIVRNTGGWDGK